MDYPEKDFEGYVKEQLTREFSPPPRFVTDTIYWAILNGEMVGRISCRHVLNEFLAIAGGHIGYIVRPSHQRRGFASEMLKQILQTSRPKQIGKVLLTCDETNRASEKVILKNGGVFEGYVDMGPDKPKKKRFWITL